MKSKLYKSIGLFNTKDKLSADYDFAIRLLQKNITNVEVSEPLGYFRVGGRSGGVKTWIETKEVLLQSGVWDRVYYKVIFSSIIKSFIAKVIPLKALKLLKMVRKKSKNVFY